MQPNQRYSQQQLAAKLLAQEADGMPRTRIPLAPRNRPMPPALGGSM